MSFVSEYAEIMAHLRQIESRLITIKHKLNELGIKIDVLVQNAVDEGELAALSTSLKTHTEELSTALASESSSSPVISPRPTKESVMNPILQGLADQVTAATTVMDSATTFCNGEAARIQAAIDKAIAGGATAEELAPVQAEADALKQFSDTLGAALVANTPAAGLAKKK